MALSLDPQVAAALQHMLAGMGDIKPPAAFDLEAQRENGNGMFRLWAKLQPVPTDVVTRDFSVRAHDGKEILLRWFERRGARPGSVALYVHGGGMILGSVDVFDEILKRYVSASGVPLLAVDYRLPPEHPYPTPVEDCYAGLRWLAEHGCEEIRLCVDQDDENKVVSMTRWTTRRAYEDYLEWRDGRGDTAMFREMLIRDMDVNYYDEVFVVQQSAKNGSA